MVLLGFIGMGISTIGFIWLLIVAFKTRILWGIGCLLIFPLKIIFLFLYWNESKNPFFLQVVGAAITFGASSMIS